MPFEPYPKSYRMFAFAVFGCMFIAWGAFILWGFLRDPKLRYLPALLVSVAPALVVMFGVGRQGWRAYHRRREALLAGKCRRCRYDLRGSRSHTCPECGTPIASSAKATRPTD